MKVLILDIETSPLVSHTWGLWQQNVGLEQIIEKPRVIGVAAKWTGQKRVFWLAEDARSHEDKVTETHALMSEADLIVHFNGLSFDMPWLRTEFIQAGLTPPAPHRDVDLMQVVKKQFRFPSNKLAYVTADLGLSGKMQNSGHSLWKRCLAGDEKAWREMKRYAVQDVRVTEELYDRLKPWIKNLPSPALYDEDGNPTQCGCGNTRLQRRGWAYTEQSKYARYACVGDEGCGAWLRSTKRAKGVDLVRVK